MNIPKTIKIGGINYSVRELDCIKDTGGDLLGRCNAGDSTIELKKDQSRENKESTFLHEIIEAINSQFEINLDHKTICVLETALYQILKDNKLF